MICINDLDETPKIINSRGFADASCLSTPGGKRARGFKYLVMPSMAGITVGIAPPMSYFPFGGAGESMFADINGLCRELFRFWTVNSRLPSASIRGRPSNQRMRCWSGPATAWRIVRLVREKDDSEATSLSRRGMV